MSKKINPDNKSITFIPVGGCGHFGANLSLYGYGGKWIIVDCGIGFGDEATPGIEIMFPDPAFLKSIKGDVLGLFITHAHEDHVGAVAHLAGDLDCPIHCGAFTGNVVKRKLLEYGIQDEGMIDIHKLDEEINLTQFKIKIIPVSHSIPGAFSMVIETPIGKVLHTGDWNMDPDPIVSKTTDLAAFKKVCGKDVLALIGDSTNAEKGGRGISEGALKPSFQKIFKEQKNRVAVTIFSSNIARIETISLAAKAAGRQVCAVGRSLVQMVDVARKSGYLTKVPPFLTEVEANNMPRGKVVYIVTGSQGEYRSALARIARDEHREVKFTNGDCVIFSARVIPGNEKEINHTKNTLSEAGVVVIDRYATPIHASGHPYGDELEEMVRAVAPKNLIAVHGERMQQEAHAALAIRCGVAGTLVPRNGDVISISKVGVTVDGQIHAGFLGVDGRRIIPVDHVAIKERRKLRIEGIVFASLVIDKKGHVLADPVLITRGLLDMNDEVEADLLYELEDIIADHLASTRYKPSEEGMEKMETQIRRMIRKHFQDAIGIKPQADINIHVV